MRHLSKIAHVLKLENRFSAASAKVWLAEPTKYNVITNTPISCVNLDCLQNRLDPAFSDCTQDKKALTEW